MFVKSPSRRWESNYGTRELPSGGLQGWTSVEFGLNVFLQNVCVKRRNDAGFGDVDRIHPEKKPVNANSVNVTETAAVILPGPDFASCDGAK